MGAQGDPIAIASQSRAIRSKLLPPCILVGTGRVSRRFARGGAGVTADALGLPAAPLPNRAASASAKFRWEPRTLPASRPHRRRDDKGPQAGSDCGPSCFRRREPRLDYRPAPPARRTKACDRGESVGTGLQRAVGSRSSATDRVAHHESHHAGRWCTPESARLAYGRTSAERRRQSLLPRMRHRPRLRKDVPARKSKTVPRSNILPPTPLRSERRMPAWVPLRPSMTGVFGPDVR